MDTEWLWRLGDKILAALGFIAAAITGAAFRRYTKDRAMLLRHDESIEATERELGLLRSFKETCGKGPMGDALVKAIDELKSEDRRLHERVSKTRKAVESFRSVIATMETNIQWIRETLERMESK